MMNEDVLNLTSVVVKDLRLKDKDKDLGPTRCYTGIIHTWFCMCNMKNNTFKTLLFLKVI